MSETTCLSQSFYNRDVVRVARELLGMKLIRRVDGGLLEGIILETEAYQGEDDLACHARSGKTRRNAVMYGPPGRAYVYFTYGIHWMLNCVCQEENFPAAVLIRALHPTRGHEQIGVRRNGLPRSGWTDGPAKLCQAFQIDGSLNGADLTSPVGELMIAAAPPPPAGSIQTSSRIGIHYAPEPWLSMPWRFRVNPGLYQTGENGPA